MWVWLFEHPSSGLPQSWKVLELEKGPGISLIFAESPGKVLEFYTAPSMSFSNSRTFQNCCKCYIIFYIAVIYFSILICHFVLVTPCYITYWKNSVFLFFAYSGVSKSPGISKNVLEKSWKLECKSPGKSEKKSWKVLEFDIKFSVATLQFFPRESSNIKRRKAFHSEILVIAVSIGGCGKSGRLFKL